MAINQALSGGGIQVHGTPTHVDQGDPGATTSFGTIVFDTAGAELHVYKTWQATVTYANWDVITGSNSLLYQSIVAGNLNNNPTTDDGTHWLAVSIPNKGTTNGHVPIWNSTSLRYEPGAIPTGSGLPVGTNAQMIINDGVTPYVAVTIAGDISIVNTGVVTVSKGRGNAFPAAATVKGDIWYGSNAATLSALAGNITTTQKFLAETGTGAAANAPSWVDLTAVLLPTGTDNQTIRNNAGTWEATSTFLNKSSSWEFGTGSATANVEFSIFGTGATTPILLDVVENVSSSNSVSIRALNSGLNKGTEMGFAASNDSYFTGTVAGDGIIRATGAGAGAFWIGSVTTPIAKFDATALAANKVLGTNGTGVMTIRALVTADMPAGTGTVTSFSAGDFSPLFTTTEATATTTPALSFTAITQSANLMFAGPSSGSAAAPTFRASVPLDWAASSATGGLAYSSSSTVNAWLAIGSTNQLLSVAGGIPAWQTVSGDVTYAAGVTTIGAAKVTYAMLAATAQPSFQVELMNVDAPTGTGVLTYEFTVPYAADGTTSATWTFTRLTFRLSTTSSSGNPAVHVQTYTGTGQFTNSNNVVSSPLAITAGSYENSTTTFNIASIASNSKMRVNVTTLGATTGGWSVIVQCRRTA